MKASEMTQMSDTELQAKLSELTEERFRLGFRSATEDVSNRIQFRTLRRDIARIHTILRQRRGA
jgi:large subunit ribosomal protein L29